MNSEGSRICLGKQCEKTKPIWISFSFSIAELCLVLVHNDFPSTARLKINHYFHQSLCICNPYSVLKMQLLRITQDCLHFLCFFPR